MYVQIDYEGDTSLVIEGLGPHTIVGAVSDAVYGHYTESSSGQKVERIIVGHKVTNKGTQVE